jgi:hypothetical protein
LKDINLNYIFSAPQNLIIKKVLKIVSNINYKIVLTSFIFIIAYNTIYRRDVICISVIFFVAIVDNVSFLLRYTVYSTCLCFSKYRCRKWTITHRNNEKWYNNKNQIFVKRYLLVMIGIIKILLLSIIVTNFQVRWNPHFNTIYFF